MSYKRSKAVNKIYCMMDNFLAAFNGEPEKLYLNTKQYDALVADKNKLLREQNIKEWELPLRYKGFEIKVYNP